MEAGFFTLSPCGEQTIGRCARCGRSLCQRHITAAPSGDPVCLDCAGRARDEATEPWDDEGIHWIYRLRRRHHELHRRGQRGEGRSSSWREPFWSTTSSGRSWQDHTDHDEVGDSWDDHHGSYFDS